MSASATTHTVFAHDAHEDDDFAPVVDVVTIRATVEVAPGTTVKVHFKAQPCAAMWSAWSDDLFMVPQLFDTLDEAVEGVAWLKFTRLSKQPVTKEPADVTPPRKLLA